MVQVNNARDVLEDALRSGHPNSGHTYGMDEYYRTGHPNESYPNWKKREQRYVKNMERLRSGSRQG